MKFDQKHHRRSIRLKGYDYSRSGAYFVTVVAWQREILFGDVVNGEMVLNRYGQTVLHAWMDLPDHYRHIELGSFVVMPNHVHGIVVLNDDDGRGRSPASAIINVPDGSDMSTEPVPIRQTRPYVAAKRHGLPEIVRAFKSFSARRINRLRNTDGISVWQRNYYEHIIRNEREMDRITRYIESNPLRWGDDDENLNQL